MVQNGLQAAVKLVAVVPVDNHDAERPVDAHISTLRDGKCAVHQTTRLGQAFGIAIRDRSRNALSQGSERSSEGFLRRERQWTLLSLGRQPKASLQTVTEI